MPGTRNTNEDNASNQQATDQMEEPEAKGTVGEHEIQIGRARVDLSRVDESQDVDVQVEAPEVDNTRVGDTEAEYLVGEGLSKASVIQGRASIDDPYGLVISDNTIPSSFGVNEFLKEQFPELFDA